MLGRGLGQHAWCTRTPCKDVRACIAHRTPIQPRAPRPATTPRFTHAPPRLPHPRLHTHTHTHTHTRAQTPKKLYLVLDFINGGHLFFQLYRAGTFDEPLARLYCAEIVLAIAHLHSLGFVHRWVGGVWCVCVWCVWGEPVAAGRRAVPAPAPAGRPRRLPSPSLLPGLRPLA